jgi:hypothetical protein
MAEEKFILSVGEVELVNNSCSICLFSGQDGDKLPKNMDIQSIKLLNMDNLDYNAIDKITIQIGAFNVLTYTGDEIKNMVLSEDGLLVSRVPYLKIRINFEINKQFIEDKYGYHFVDEYITKKNKSKRKFNFEDVDTGEISVGRIVKTKLVPTGRKVKELKVPHPLYKLPDIEFGMKPAMSIKNNRYEYIETPIWDRYLVNPKNEPLKDLDYRINKLELHAEDGKPILEHYVEGTPFYVKCKNYIVYNKGLCGTKYSHANSATL